MTDPDGAGPATSFGHDAFATIQAGVNGVDAGGTVQVSAGVYAENVLVTKSVMLLGPNAAIDPNTGTRGAEAIARPSVTETSLQASTSGTVFRVGTNTGHIDVTIKGFTIDGNNPALTNGRILNGVEVHTGAAIVNSIGSFDNNPNGYDATMIVQNNIIQNVERYGVLADVIVSSAAIGGTDVSFNKIDNLPSGNNFGGDRGRAISFQNNHYGTVTNNVITRVNVGWQDDNYFLAAPGGIGTLVSDNEIHTYHRGIFHNLQYGSATAATISDNQIFVETNGDFPASATNFGVELATILSNVGITVSGNDVTGTVFGIVLWNLGSSANIAVSGGTLSGNQIGVLATDNDPQFGPSGAASSASISGITIMNATGVAIAIDDTSSSSPTTLGILGGVSISGSEMGIRVDGLEAQIFSNTIANTSFSGVAGNYIDFINSAMNGTTVDGTLALFNGKTGLASTPAENALIEGKVHHRLDPDLPVNAALFTWVPNSILVPDDGSGNTARIQRGLDSAAAGNDVRVAAGSYIGDLAANNANVKLIGAGADTTTLSGAVGGDGATVRISASNVEVTGFTITREGNNTTDWNNPNLNTVGVAIQGQAITGALIHDNIFTGNRTGIDINNSNGHTIRNNIIDSNRVGLIFRNQTDNSVVEENFITNSFAVGILFLDASGGTNSPVQQALNSSFRDNNISANWYGGIVDRQTGGSLPAPGANPKNFPKNWFGTVTPVITNANSAEPGYAAQIPVIFGGTATAPGGQPDIAGPASDNFQIDPLLDRGIDSDVETVPGRGTFGFQGNFTPTLDAIANPAPILEDAVGQTVNLTGISAGGDDVEVVTVTASSNNTNLIPHPTVTYTSPNATGSLSYTPVADQSGTATITVTVDDGGDPITRTFDVEVTAVEDPATLAAIGNPAAIDEDAGVQTVNLSGISAGGGEVQTLTVTAMSSDPTIVPHPTVNYTSPNSTGSITYTPVPDQSGTGTITVTVSDGAPISRTFDVVVTAVNDTPTLTAIGNPAAIPEDSGLQTVNLAGISTGGGETQTLTVTATSNTPALIPDPTVTYTSPNSTGSLSYTPVADQSGTATITVTVSDGAAMVTRTFDVQVTSINDLPTLDAISDPVAVLEDAGLQTVNLTGIATGGGETQTLTITATSNNTNVIPHPTVTYTSPGNTGSLSYTPVPNANGSATITVTVNDGGDSVTRTFNVAVTSVNDAPNFTVANQSVVQDAGQQSVQLAAISAGPTDESGQTLTFEMLISDSSLFSGTPTLSSAGVLTFTPLPTASGTTTVDVTLRDNGGTADSGADSVTKSFTISITTFIEETGTYNGLVQAPVGVTPENPRAGLIRVTIAKKGTFSGNLKIGGSSYPLKGNFTKDGVAHFKLNATSFAYTIDRVLRLQLDVSGGTDKLTGTITSQAGPFAAIEADRALYSAAKVPKPPFMSVPPALISKYTVHFAPKSPVDQGRPADDYPQGHGVATLSVSKAGVAKLVGTLADGTRVSYSNSLSKGNVWPFYVVFPKGAGSISGPVEFAETPNVSDLDGLNLNWFKLTGSLLYPRGWATGIRVDLFGSKFARPVASAGQSILLTLPAVDTDGNVEARLTEGNVAAPGIFKALTVQPNNRVQVVAPAADNLKLSLVPGTGLVNGSFIHPVSGKKVAIKGVIDQKRQLGFGYFLDVTESGSFTLVPEAQPGTP